MSDIVESKKRQEDILKKIAAESEKYFKTVGERDDKKYPKYSIVLLLDTSGSMAGKKIDDAKQAIIDFLRRNDLKGSEVGLVTFGAEVRKFELNYEPSFLEGNIKDLEAKGETPMMRAIKTARNELKEKPNQVIVIATDGHPKDAKESEILEYAASLKRKGTRIITIGIGEDLDREFLASLASSPDENHFAAESVELKIIYKKVGDRLFLEDKRGKLG